MIEINNLTSFSVDKKFLKKIAERIFKKEKRTLKLSVALVGEQRIKKLNKKYRKKDKTTDTLSFLYDGSGDIVICAKEVKKNAKKYGVGFKTELARILIHGILHLLGQNHKDLERAKEMNKKQEYYLSKILNLKKIRPHQEKALG